MKPEDFSSLDNINENSQDPEVRRARVEEGLKRFIAIKEGSGDLVLANFWEAFDRAVERYCDAIYEKKDTTDGWLLKMNVWQIGGVLTDMQNADLLTLNIEGDQKAQLDKFMGEEVKQAGEYKAALKTVVTDIVFEKAQEVKNLNPNSSPKEIATIVRDEFLGPRLELQGKEQGALEYVWGGDSYYLKFDRPAHAIAFCNKLKEHPAIVGAKLELETVENRTQIRLPIKTIDCARLTDFLVGEGEASEQDMKDFFTKAEKMIQETKMFREDDEILPPSPPSPPSSPSSNIKKKGGHEL